MNALPFKPDCKLTDFLKQHRFTRSAEIIPPRNGSEQRKVFEQIEMLKNAGAQFLAVTKGAGGSLRGGSLPIAQAIKESFSIPTIAHFTCRDLLAPEVESHLIDHHYFGIRNILALRGDPPDGQPDWHARQGGYNFAHELIAQISALNKGNFMPRPGFQETPGSETTDFCIGAAAYPEFPDPIKRIEFFHQKITAGAHFGITDMLFDAEAYARFVDQCASRGSQVPILPGTRILKSRKQAEKMMQKFKVSVPREYLNSLPEENPSQSTDQDGMKRGVDQFLKLSARLERLGAPGIHLFVISDSPTAVLGLKTLSGV